MLNKETIKKLYERCDNILANLAYNDWWNTNKNSPRARLGKFTPAGKQREWLPYSLSDDTLEARNIIQLIHDEMDREAEEKVKGFIMKYRLLNPEYLEKRS